jgi:L-lactate dehydrogenase complex protein LldG
MNGREAILGRVRAAIGGDAPPSARRYRTTGGLDAEARITLFCERVGEYRAEVRRIGRGEVASALTELCAARRLVVPAGLPTGWRPDGV